MEASERGHFLGIRWQMIRALRGLASGEQGLVRYKIADLSKHIENAEYREKFFEQLKIPATWNEPGKIEFLLVPGTLFPAVIGPILLNESMVTICHNQGHWVSNLRYYSITDIGRDALTRGEAWWSSLTFFQKLKIAFSE